VPADVIAEMGLDSGRRELRDQLSESINAITVDHGIGMVHVRLEPLQSFAWSIGDGMFKPPEETPFIDDPEGARVSGTLSYWKNVASDFLAEPRTVAIWLPPGYGDNPDKHYRVIYMTDGENILDPRIASWGVDWGVDEAMMRGAEKGSFEPAIVVGAWSSSQRRDEYSPWHDASKYARFLTEELMPRINREFRTLIGPENTFALGSSMGSLLSYYLVKNHPDAFGACGCVRISPAEIPCPPVHASSSTMARKHSTRATKRITSQCGNGFWNRVWSRVEISDSKSMRAPTTASAHGAPASVINWSGC
jgi:pimeloyl-ACP methyl ester carboxylesterase